MDPAEAFAWLDAHVNLESGVGTPSGVNRRASVPTLDRIRALTDRLGRPQASYPAIHVTGTNGKTSSARMIAALLDSAGLSVGLYTSPHLESVHERLAHGGGPIDDESLAEELSAVATAEDLAGFRASYFEILTAAALRWFEDVAVDVAVVEVGVGGTWDATNVVDGEVAVITNVSLDHVEYLGPTRESIAREKAGIVKPGSTFVLGETDPALAPIFDAVPAAAVVHRGSDFQVVAERMAHGGRLVELRTPRGDYPDVFLPLHGAHQAANAVVALTAVEAFLGRAVGPGVVVPAFAAVRSPGRLEIVGHQPLWLLDGAHNVAGAEALSQALAEEFAVGDRTWVVGLLREKDPTEMLTGLGVQPSERIVCVAPPSARALDPEAVAAAARDRGVPGGRVHVVGAVRDALDLARTCTAADGQIIVTGSLYLVGAARHELVPSGSTSLPAS